MRARYHFQVNGAGRAAHQALGSLVVWNDDEIAVGGGFPMHGHRDIEIITYVRQGVLGHRDTLGSEGAIHAGDVQVMSAGTGIRHAEFNKGDLPLRIYQIWLLPRQRGGGRIEVDGEPMDTFDGVAITNAAAIEVCALQDSELLLVETDTFGAETTASPPRADEQARFVC